MTPDEWLLKQFDAKVANDRYPDNGFSDVHTRRQMIQLIDEHSASPYICVMCSGVGHTLKSYRWSPSDQVPFDEPFPLPLHKMFPGNGTLKNFAEAEF